MKIEVVRELLEKRYSLKLEWVEPRPAVSVDGVSKTATVKLYALVSDCIDMAREAAVQRGDRMAYSRSEEDCLLDFMVIHWAYVMAEKP